MWKYIALLLNLASAAYGADNLLLQPTLAPARECRCLSGGLCLCDECECQPTKFVSALGYGHPQTLAPLLVADQKPRLTAAEAATATKLYEVNHGPLLSGAKAVAKAPAVATKAAAAAVRAPVRYVRRLVVTRCAGGVCTPQYQWVPEAQPMPVQPRYRPLRRGLRRW
jgi:hypothetical protein